MKTLDTALELPRPAAQPSALGRSAVFLYGVLAYAVGVTGLGWLIGACLGLIPLGASGFQLESTGAALALNLGFVLLFGMQHVIMARPSFKKRWTRIVHPAIERSTFVAITGVIMSSTLWFWQPMPTNLWLVEDPTLALGITGLAVLGWTYLFAASFAIDHFELFGLAQVWRHFRGTQPPSVPFVQRFMYRFDRHPIMTGMLIGLWVTPDMRLDHLVLAAAFTIYMIIGVTIEERTLVHHHGDGYREYRRKVAALVPFPGRRS